MVDVPARARYFYEMCAGFAADGRRLLCYEAGGTTLAMKCDLAAGHGMHFVRKTYNEEFARLSPGVLLEIGDLNMFHNSGADWMESCTIQVSDPPFRLWPGRTVFTDLLGTLGGAVGWCAMHGQPVVDIHRTLRGWKPSSVNAHG